MELDAFLQYLNSGKTVEKGSEPHLFMHRASQEALRLTAEINGSYHTPEELRGNTVYPGGRRRRDGKIRGERLPVREKLPV